MKKLTLSSYYGGKNKWLKQLLPYFQTEHQSFASGFCGMCSVELNKPPSFLEILNDKDDNIYTLLKVVRDHPRKLQRLLQNTPWSRTEFDNCRGSLRHLPELERARRFYVRLRQGFNSVPRDNSGNGFKYCKTGQKRGAVSTRTWANGIAQIPDIRDRLLRYQIECLDIMDFIPLYDTASTLFFLDPPYVKSTRNRATDHYAHEMTDEQHLQMLDLCVQARGKFLICGYASDLYDKHPVLKDWNRVEMESRAITSSRERATRQEVLWFNFDPPPASPQAPTQLNFLQGAAA